MSEKPTYEELERRVQELQHTIRNLNKTARSQVLFSRNNDCRSPKHRAAAVSKPA